MIFFNETNAGEAFGNLRKNTTQKRINSRINFMAASLTTHAAK
jgi:hypothetical protein